MQWFYRLQARWRIVVNHGDELNRRVTVENVLLNVASGKRPMLTKEECRQLAYKLGIPTKYAAGSNERRTAGNADTGTL